MPWIDIKWEEKHFYNNTTSTSYGNLRQRCTQQDSFPGKRRRGSRERKENRWTSIKG